MSVRDLPPVDLCQDRAWLKGFRAGEPEALERVFRTYAPLVFQVARQGVRLKDGTRATLQDASEQDDVVQDCFLRLLSPTTRARYDGIRPYGAWVRTVAHRSLIDFLRKRGRVQDFSEAVLEEEKFGDNAAVAASPEEPLLTAEEGRMAEAVLASFTEDERRFASVRFEQGLSQRDAAQVLGMSRQNVRTLESRLMAKARQFLQKHGW